MINELKPCPYCKSQMTIINKFIVHEKNDCIANNIKLPMEKINEWNDNSCINKPAMQDLIDIIKNNNVCKEVIIDKMNNIVIP